MLGLLEFYDLVVELGVFWSDLGWLMSSEILCTVVTSWFGIGVPERNLPTLGCQGGGVTGRDTAWLAWDTVRNTMLAFRCREVPFPSEFRVRWICNCLDWLLNKFRYVRVVDLSAYLQRTQSLIVLRVRRGPAAQVVECFTAGILDGEIGNGVGKFNPKESYWFCLSLPYLCSLEAWIVKYQSSEGCLQDYDGWRIATTSASFQFFMVITASRRRLVFQKGCISCSIGECMLLDEMEQVLHLWNSRSRTGYLLAASVNRNCKRLLSRQQTKASYFTTAVLHEVGLTCGFDTWSRLLFLILRLLSLLNLPRLLKLKGY